MNREKYTKWAILQLEEILQCGYNQANVICPQS